MDFIVDNYFWFIVGGIVLLMIIIGYIAEKTDFGRKPFKEKKVDNKDTNNETEVVNEEVVENVEEVENQVADSESLADFMMEDGFADMELSENVEGEENVIEQIEDIAPVIDESTETAAIEEPMTDLDIPEIASDVKEDVPEVSDVVEEAIVDDSEDDVWKF